MAPRKADRVLELAQRIRCLESELSALRTELGHLVGDDAVEQELPVVAKDPAPSGPPPKGYPIAERVQAVLDMHAAPLTAQYVAAMIGESLDSVRAALSRLINRGTTIRVSTGFYLSSRAGHRSAPGDDQ